MNVERLMLDIKAIAEWMEADGNTGYYPKEFGDTRYVLDNKYKPYRDGILFYSTGWGWRVRKKPHWKTVYDERVAKFYKAPEHE